MNGNPAKPRPARPGSAQPADANGTFEDAKEIQERAVANGGAIPGQLPPLDPLSPRFVRARYAFTPSNPNELERDSCGHGTDVVPHEAPVLVLLAQKLAEPRYNNLSRLRRQSLAAIRWGKESDNVGKTA
ncbi:uncharacterized protein LACBIDRAFT_328630 [Laccaria bicolor S238N-H82]|uniref:Predicted protein n=1 Tax=Laccaria bicolor (strain S238N-H82 / ATCC MYA-4686) TaxID=486041 RepID=B0DFH4_LACBS|nr:uncharacterized protein LACBIDRAFT_328630 [Laccaria bicolor S238N-H82]EDR06706.1 predicted protein [Laccaria bicolor S238N-H82]|eukprot:XP_001882553.1 predicted protein [Laccaria bicolor S238N-H82]